MRRGRSLPGDAGRGSRRGRVEILPVPELEDQQLPEPQRVIAASGQVLVQQPVDERRLEVAALAGPGRPRTSENTSVRPPRNQTPSGTPNPCFFRSRMPAGSSVRTASFRMCLRRPLLILSARAASRRNR